MIFSSEWRGKYTISLNNCVLFVHKTFNKIQNDQQLKKKNYVLIVISVFAAK